MLAAALRGVVYVAPALLSCLLVFAVTATIDLGGAGTLELALWWIGLSAGATAVLYGADRLARRLLPLVALLRVSLAFPDRLPGRLRTAAGGLAPARLIHDLARARADDDEDPAVAAARLLRLVAALGDHDGLTRGHSERVRAYARVIGEELGLDRDALDRLNWAALLHDVGKLAVSARILGKDGPPTDEEWDELRRHPEEGMRMAAPLTSWLGVWGEAIGDHHERWDGGGYPCGLSGDAISLGGRIVAVADVFDVLTSHRPYARAVSRDAALAEITRSSGSQFDPEVVRALLSSSFGRPRIAYGPLAWLAHTPIVARALHIPSGVVQMGAAALAAGAIAGGAIAADVRAPATGAERVPLVAGASTTFGTSGIPDSPRVADPVAARQRPDPARPARTPAAPRASSASAADPGSAPSAPTGTPAAPACGVVSGACDGPGPPASGLVERLPLPEAVEELPLPDVVDELPVPDVVDELPLPEVAAEVPLPDVVEDLPVPEVIEQVPVPAPPVAPPTVEAPIPVQTGGEGLPGVEVPRLGSEAPPTPGVGGSPPEAPDAEVRVPGVGGG